MRKLLVFSLLILGACAKNNSQPQPTSPNGLADKPAADVLNEKYEKANLVCRLLVRSDDEKRPRTADSFSVDLKRESSISGTARLSYKEGRHSIVVNIDIREPRILASVALNNGRSRYAMKNTVTVPFQYSYQIQHKKPDSFGQSSSDGGRNYDDSFYERVPYQVLLTRSNDLIEKVECTLETELKPDYAGDFQEL
jgi:hypothetical protein